MLRIVQFLVGGFDQNFSYVVYDDEFKETAIVDPSGDVRKLKQFIDDSGLKVQQVLLTHTHPDHYDALRDVVSEYNIEKIGVHKSVKDTFKHKHLEFYEDEDLVTVGTTHLTLLHTPGHTPDSVCFYAAPEHTYTHYPQVITGDTLFVDGCGRTSEDGVQDLYDSLQRLKTLPANTTINPGHNYGRTTTSALSYEMEHNKYLLAEDFDTFRALRLPK